MLLLALHLLTAPVSHLEPVQVTPTVVNPDGGRKRRDGREDEDAR